MNEVEALQSLLRVFQEKGVPHAISGSMASNAYGEVRSTKDADIVMAIEWARLGEIFNALEPEFEIDRQLRLEGVTATSRFVLKHRASRFVIELFLLSNDPFDHSRFERRVPDTYLGFATFFMSPEDTVVQKALWFKRTRNRKHRDDLLGVLRVQAGQLDWNYIHRWAEQHGTRALLEEIREEVERSRPPSDGG
jgi:hypothetical protein